ncbi:unnamed protein product [Effrenium voratum]|nr:unnamed protein product [Effrenium voratum]
MLCGLLGGAAASEKEEARVSAPQLAGACFVAGHLALRMLVFLEGLQSALKRQRLAQEEAKMAEQREKSKEKKEKGGKKSKGKAAAAEEEEEDKGGESMGGVGLEEREAEAFAQIAENGLLYSTNRLLDRVKPLLFACLLDKELRTSPLIRRVGAISLCKFMTVSKRFCQENLQLLFSVLFPKNGKSQLAGGEDVLAQGGLLEDLTLRQSLLVAVGDLLFRHPNVVEPWTGRLYATLSAPSGDEAGEDLRLTALLVLTHLVLNDMMKPRPVLLIRALWLTACKHEATARVARILFQELAKRSTNVVYNLLPEIVARLPEHVAEQGVEGGATGRVQYIMQFVEKEKHIEGLIEKFTLRLEQCASGGGEAAPSQDDEGGSPVKVEDTVACLAHALGAMNYSERCLLRLHDVVAVRKALKLALSYHPVVRECLLAVVERRRGSRGRARTRLRVPMPAPKPAPSLARVRPLPQRWRRSSRPSMRWQTEKRSPRTRRRRPSRRWPPGRFGRRRRRRSRASRRAQEGPRARQRPRQRTRGQGDNAPKENAPNNARKGKKRKAKGNDDDDDEDYE